MITDEQIHRQTYEERDAWLASLDADQTAIAHTPSGHRWTLVVISETKRLLSMNLSAEDRLRFLEFLESCTDNFLTEKAVAIIEPMDHEAHELLKETRRLGAK